MIAERQPNPPKAVLPEPSVPSLVTAARSSARRRSTIQLFHPTADERKGVVNISSRDQLREEKNLGLERKRAIDEFPQAHFINAFGQTETAATITMLPPEDHALDGTPQEVEKKLRRLSSIGKPLQDVDVRIVDEDGEPVAQGDVGEIVARGARLMKGYWNQAEATAEAIRGGWLYTGDMGYFDDDGYIFLSGRAKDFIKRGGEMISPEEVEQLLCSHPAIDEAAIIGVPDADWGERVRAVVVLKDGQAASEEDVIDYCRRRLASFKKPESVVFADALPRNPLGKVLKRELREQYGYPVETVES